MVAVPGRFPGAVATRFNGKELGGVLIEEAYISIARRNHFHRCHETRSLRTGLTLTEVLIVLALAATVVLVLLMAVPRAREQARLAGCRRNLGQIGMALALYDQFQNHLPIVGRPAALDDQTAAPEAGANAGPLRTMLETLGLPDFTELSDAKKAPQPRPGEVPGETAVPGFVCQSDPFAMARRFLAPVSYRAVTGDSPDGNNGPLRPGARCPSRRSKPPTA